MCKLLTLFILLTYIQLKAKPTKEIQVGFSYNTFKWQITDPVAIPSIIIFKYNRFNIQPIFRYNKIHHFNNVKLSNLNITRFIGYSIFGGKSKSDTSKYKEKYAHHSIELGIQPSYKIYKNLSLGIGFKINYTPLTFYNYYGTIYQSNSNPREWYLENVSKRFKNISTNLGFNIKYQYNKYSFTFETWFGLTNIDKLNSDLFNSNIKENNYRLLMGYLISKKKNK